MQASEATASGPGGFQMLVFRPVGHLVKNSDLELWPRDLCFSYPPLHMEIPHCSASGKRVGPAVAQAPGIGLWGPAA